MNNDDIDETRTAEAGHVPFLVVQGPDRQYLKRFVETPDGYRAEWQSESAGQMGAEVMGPARAGMVVERMGPNERGLWSRVVQKTCDMVSGWEAVQDADGVGFSPGDEIMCREVAVAMSNDGVAMCRSCAARMAAENDPDIYVARWSP